MIKIKSSCEKTLNTDAHMCRWNNIKLKEIREMDRHLVSIHCQMLEIKCFVYYIIIEELFKLLISG